MESAAHFTATDFQTVVLWDTNHFGPRPDDKRICGRRVAEGLFSVEAFATNKGEAHRLARALAARLLPPIVESIKAVEAGLKEAEASVKAELAEPHVASIQIAMDPPKTYTLGIPKGRATYSAMAFLRLFVIMDSITAGLKELHFKGALTISEYKQRENAYAKPLRKLMNDTHVLVKKYHNQRRALKPMLEEQLVHTSDVT